MSMYRTTDVAIAAWLRVRGCVLVSHRRLAKNKLSFEFAITEEEADRLKVEFASSECAQFNEAVRILKKLIYD